jgi:biopolymer transport protein ExbD
MPLNFSTGRKPLAEFSLAGLTDIVLLLLIFFLLTSTFVVQAGVPVTLPQADAGPSDNRNYLEVAITRDGRMFVAGEQVEGDEVERAIAAVRGNRDALVLRADAQATVEQFAQVAAAARRLDLRVLMATEAPR